MLLYSFSLFFSDRQPLKIENENNNTNEDHRSPIYRTRVPRVEFINIKTYHGWLELPLTGTSLPGPEVIKLFSYSTQLSMKFLNAHKYKNIKKFGFF